MKVQRETIEKVLIFLELFCVIILAISALKIIFYLFMIPNSLDMLETTRAEAFAEIKVQAMVMVAFAIAAMYTHGSRKDLL